MGLVTKTFTFAPGALIIASEHNTNFDTLYTLVNGNLDNANVNGAAAIVASKLDLSTIVQNITFSGTLDLNAATITTQTTFADLVATTADINGGTIDNAEIGATDPDKATVDSLHLPEGAAPSTAASEGAVYTKDSEGQPELVDREESDCDEVPHTSGGRTVSPNILYTSNDTFVAPAGTTMVFVTMCGGGGGGGGKDNSQNAGSGGGGSENFTRMAYPVVGGNSYTVTIGTGGSAGTGGNPGTQPTAGGNTIFNDGETDGTSELVATGGGEGETPTGGTATGGTGGAALSIDGTDGGSGVGGGGRSIAGGDGGDGGNGSQPGGGAGSAFGLGGDGVVDGSGNDGTGYGSGGGGGSHSTAGTTQDGGGGTAGFCLIEFF